MKQIFTIIAVLLLLNSTASAQNKYWTWVGYSDTRNWDEFFQEITDVGLTGIIMSAGRESLEKVIPIAQKYGVDVHAWLWIMNNGGIAASHPEWLDYNQKGESMRDSMAYVGYYKFLNPAIAEARRAIADGVADVAKTKGLQGISMDYCRYVDAILPEALWGSYGIIQDKVYPKWDYGYHPEMIAQFTKKYGYDPRALADPTQDTLWLDFRCQVLNQFVDSLSTIVHSAGKELSASPFPTPAMSKQMVRQDWGRWPLDRAFPMIYHGFYYGGVDWIAQCVRECRQTMNPNGELYLGLYIPDFGNPKGPTITQAVQAGLDNGAKGIAMYTYDNLSKEQKEELKKVIQKNK
ncbi:MAG: family 10 glycosylhydrolase [Mucinivorans sp.]